MRRTNLRRRLPRSSVAPAAAARVARRVCVADAIVRFQVPLSRTSCRCAPFRCCWERSLTVDHRMAARLNPSLSAQPPLCPALAVIRYQIRPLEHLCPATGPVSPRRPPVPSPESSHRLASLFFFVIRPLSFTVVVVDRRRDRSARFDCARYRSSDNVARRRRNSPIPGDHC